MRWRVLAGLLLVLVTGWLLAGAAATTFARTDSATYPVSFAGASWIQAPSGASHAYFRLPLELTATPDLATLWIDANQQYRVYANGEDVAGSESPVQSGRPQLADPVDLSWRLRKGPNAIGVKAVAGDGGPAAIRARLTLTFGSKQVSYVTSAATWLATANAQQVHYPGSNTKDASFSSTAFDASLWPHAARAPAVRQRAWSLMPPQVVAGPLTGQVISASAGTDTLASTIVGAPAGLRDGWLRVIAADPYTVSVDGRAIAQQPSAGSASGTGTQQWPQAAVRVYDIRPYLHAGRNPLAVHVQGSQPAAIYLDGILDTATGPVRIATGPRWQVTASPLLTADAASRAAARPVIALGPVGRIWPQGVRRAGVVPDPALPASTGAAGHQQQGAQTAPLPAVPGGVSLRYTLAGIALVLGLWLGFAAVTSRVARLPAGRALLIDAAGHLPALACLGAVAALAHLANWTPPWPYTPAVFWLLVAILAAGKLLAPISTARPALPLPHPHQRHLAAAPARLPFGSRLVLAEAGAPARTVTLPPAAAPAWRRAGRLRPGLLDPVLDRARRPLTYLVSRLTWATGGVVAIALAGTGLLSYRLGYEPFSGDEAASLLAARSIRAHLLPRFPSGLLYLKGELYHYPLAAYSAIVGDSPVALRLPTVLTYGATVLAFGLLLLPIVLRGHRLAQVALTLLFASAPMELQEARLVRMYQQEQLFAILFLAFFLLALRAGRVSAGLEQRSRAPAGRLWELATRWSIPLSAVTLTGMYLSHEESFILLPAIPVALVAGLRLRWLRDRRWLLWGGPALAVIGAQYGLTLIARMPVLGFDDSNKPYIYYDPSQFYYYFTHYLLAIPGGSGGVPAGSGDGTLYLVTSLAVVAGAVGVARRDFGRLYLTTFFWVPVLVLSTLFSAQAERYVFILLPMLVALAGLGCLDILGWLRALLTAGGSGRRERRLVAGLILAAAVPGFAWLAGSMPARVQDYGLAVSRLAGVPDARQQPDYGTVAAYLTAHEDPGDLFITLAPTADAAYYAGRPPDMVIQPHPNRFLYLTEKNGIVVEDYFGRPVVLTASDLQQVIASHRRVWLMTDQGAYFSSVPDNMAQLIRAQFTEVDEGTQTALYVTGGLCGMWRLMRSPGVAVAIGLAIALLLAACQQAPRPSRTSSPHPAPGSPSAPPAPPPGSAAAGQPATAARIHDILQSMNAYGFNPHAPPTKGTSQPGGLFINWRGTWDGNPETAAANTNIQTSGLPDQQAGSEPRHDPLTDLVYLRNLYAYQAIDTHDREYDSAIARMEPIVQQEYAHASYYRCWVYFQLRDLGELSPGHGWDTIAAHFAAGVYQHFYDNQAGAIADLGHSGSYRTDFAAECGAMLIDAGHRQHNAAWTTAGTATLAHLLRRAQNPATHLFPLQMSLGRTGDTVAQAQLKMGEEAQLLDAFLDAYDLTGNASYLGAVVQAANSLYSPAIGLWDRAHGGFYFAVDADGHLLETAYEETRQAWMLPLLQHLARIEGGVWTRREQAMLTVVRDKLWQPGIHGYPYRETPGFAVYQTTNGPGHTRVMENWVSSEAMGIAGEALEDQLLPPAGLCGGNNGTMKRATWPPRLTGAAMSHCIDELLGNARAYARAFDKGALPITPRLGVAVVACMDARLNLDGILGLTEGDAHVIRNAGGVITEDVIRSLTISQRLLATTEIMLIHHANCCMRTFRDDEFKAQIEADAGIRPPWSTEAFGDATADARQSINRIKASPFLPHLDAVRGFIYNERTGVLAEVTLEVLREESDRRMSNFHPDAGVGLGTPPEAGPGDPGDEKYSPESSGDDGGGTSPFPGNSPTAAA